MSKEWVQTPNGDTTYGHYNEQLGYERLDMIDDTTLDVGLMAVDEPSGTPLQEGYHDAINKLMGQADEVYQTMREV